MTYTEQQLADLYGLAVSAELEEKREDAYKQDTFALDEAVLQLAPGGYAQLIRTLIDQLRAAGRKPEPGSNRNRDIYIAKLPSGLERSTQQLVMNAAEALADKLLVAQEKRPADPVGWQRDNWEEECRAGLLSHIQKGDPLDVMAYAAFMHYHGWSTRPEQQTFEEWFRKHHQHSEITMALRKDEHGNYESTVAAKLFDVYQLGASQPPVNTGLRWDDYKAISDRADVHDAVQDLMGDTTEDNAINLIRSIAEALRPRPRFWLDMHGFRSQLFTSEAEAVASCNSTGGLYVLPLFAGEPINAKLPVRMCRPADEPQTIEVSPLLRNLQAIPQRYTSDHVSLGEVFAVIEALRGAK